MPQLKHFFTSGKMNKDLDERMVPNGEYRDALNVQVSSSEGSDVGAIENVLGNSRVYKRSSSPDVFWPASLDLTNAKTVGSIKNEPENKIYWFIASQGISAIAEYDENTGLVAPVLVDTLGVIDFDASSFITGINVVDDFLIWTDNKEEPKKINISRFKQGSTDFLSHTQVYGRDFIESDTTIIKKRPQNAPLVEKKSTRKTGSGVGCGINTIETTFKFTEPIAASYRVFSVGEQVDLTFDVQPDWAVDDIIQLTGSKINDSNFVDEYTVRVKIISVPAASPWTFTVEIQTIPTNMVNQSLVWTAVLEEDDPMFKFTFPRLAYRWKYIDGEYSGFSPFTSVVFIPDSFGYSSSDAYNDGMVNNLRYLRVHGFETAPDDVVEIDILFKESNKPVIYKVESIDVTETEYEIDSEIIGNAIPSNQTLRVWDNVPKKALAQDIAGNRIVYGNYVQGYDIDKQTVVAGLSSSTHSSIGDPEESMKSSRTYQIGVVFGDEYGRETPVFTSGSGGVVLPKKNAKDVNALTATLTSTPPAWADYFKYYIKDTSNEYYNLALDRFYKADDGNIWLSFPSAERNKVAVGDYLILKKIHDDNAAVDEDVRYKILDIENQAPDDVSIQRVFETWSTVVRSTGSGLITEGTTTIKFDGPTYADDSKFFEVWDSNAIIRLSYNDGSGWNETEYYEVSRGGYTGEKTAGGDYIYEVELKDALGNEATFLSSINAGDSYRVEVYVKKPKYRKEYRGKFFVKINRDSAFDNYIIDPQFALDPDYLQIAQSNILSLTITDDPDDSLTEPSQFAWGEYGTSNQPVPVQGSNSFSIIYAPHQDGVDAQGNLDQTATETGLTWFDDALEPDSYIKFSNDPDGKYYKIASTSVSVQTRGNNVPPLGSDDVSLIKTVTLEENIASDTSTWSGVGADKYEFNIYKVITNWDDILDSDGVVLSSPLPAIFETVPVETAELEIYYEATNAIPVAQAGTEQTLSYFNCYSFGNGVESNRIQDDFNALVIDKGTKASAELDEPYAEEHKKNGLIYSGIYNTVNGINNLNQFIAAEEITKDLNPIYGSIQKLHTRDTDINVFCEDKVLRVLANKDALYNADGNVNITSTKNVLGQAVPYSGEYGISKNPESFASFGFRAYFADKSRGVVMRLSRDGITDISQHGMSDYIQEALKVNSDVIGSYDAYSGQYNVSIGNETLSFTESVRGWVSRKSFYPETGLSMNNVYYTFKNGDMWSHNNESRANFYGAQYDTSVTLMINDSPSQIKNFKTLSYEGLDGWTALVDTDQQDGEVVTWKNKEGIYYNYIRGRQDSWDNDTQQGTLDTSEFSVQGIGTISSVDESTQGIFGITVSGDINVSLQESNDDLVFYQDVSTGNIYKIGTCASISGSLVNVNEQFQVDTPEAGDFLFFVKNSQINTSGIIGYYAKVKMTTTSSEFKELFAVNSEIFVSS